VISLNAASLKQSKPHEYVVRFFFGGICTVGAGLIARRFGPGIGGLFLAFPAIFPAGACLIESHEKRHKREAGFDGTQRGRQAAGVDALGAAVGAIGLIAFAAVVWRMLERHSAGRVIGGAAMAWAIVAITMWWLKRILVHTLRRKRGIQHDRTDVRKR
jgi:hypothetical protein